MAEITAKPFWRWGIYPTIELPHTAPAEQVIEQVFSKTSFEQEAGYGPVKNYKIRKSKSVQIPALSGDIYNAAIVSTDHGEKIVLFKYETTAQKWWSRVYRSPLDIATVSFLPATTEGR